jgi:hypothetical protein
MATEGHRRNGKKIHQQPSKAEMDKELTEIRVRMEELALQMQQDARVTLGVRMAHEDEGKMASWGIGGQKTAKVVK